LRHGDEIQIGDCLFLFLEQTPGAVAEMDGLPTVASITRTIYRAEESRYLTPGKVSEELAATPASGASRIARDLDTLLAVSVSLQAVQGVEAIGRGMLEAVMRLTPARMALLWWNGLTVGWKRECGAADVPAGIRRVVEGLLGERGAMLSEMTDGVLATAPIVAFGKLTGVLAAECGSLGPPLDADHLQLLAAVAGISGPLLEHAGQVEELESENRRLRKDVVLSHGMVGESAAMRTLLEKIGRVAPADSTVLIRGESGVGKELVARALHAGSPRAGKPFVAINCATLSETLLESELFGHEKGAFTGAIAQKKGKIEAAAGGTLFLDEVSEMAPAMQAKLLRVLQEREFERVGSTRVLKADVRFVAASNRDLEEAVERGDFRRDLFYRLNVIPLVVAPLRERREDIPLLAGFFVARFAAKTGRKVKGLSAAARAYLMRYDWPGNVRELENAMERAVVLGTGDTVIPEDLPETILEGTSPPAGVAGGGYHEALNQAKAQLILAAIEKCDGSHGGAAKLLGLHPNYLSRLIRNLNIKDAVKAAGQ
ncbi:MAG: sigma-54-dependent Fis family transcriptional regulator, partial [Bryobacterales bacterium]|nr:sigma-54-dependent Fis family transcriptional regulator [Bryobacterales bacterium]